MQDGRKGPILIFLLFDGLNFLQEMGEKYLQDAEVPGALSEAGETEVREVELAFLVYLFAVRDDVAL